jgi:hypothetical protein
MIYTRLCIGIRIRIYTYYQVSGCENDLKAGCHQIDRLLTILKLVSEFIDNVYIYTHASLYVQ